MAKPNGDKPMGRHRWHAMVMFSYPKYLLYCSLFRIPAVSPEAWLN